MLSDFQFLHLNVIYFGIDIGSVPLQRLSSFCYESQISQLSLEFAMLFFNATLGLQMWLHRFLVKPWSFRNLNINDH